MLKLSIIIPVYNVEAYLEKCLNSVIYPQLSDYEIIIVNDGSTDRSTETAREYAARYPDLISLIETENGGLGAARNVGIEAAQGEYLAFLDSDDYLAKNAVPEMLEVIDGSFDLCLYNMVSINAGGTVLDAVRGFDGNASFFSLSQEPGLLFASPAACNKLVKRSLFSENGIYFPGRVWFEDLRTMPKFYLHTDKIKYLSRDWYFYLNRPGSITNSKSKVSRNSEIIDALNDLSEYYRNAGEYEAYAAEFEYLFYYHQFLTASVRVIMANPSSEVIDDLTGSFLDAFPNFRKNPYILQSSTSHKLLTFLLCRGMYHSVRFIMRLNNLLKRKDT